VIERLAEAACQPANHGYPGYGGRVELREAIRDHYVDRFAVSLDPDRQIVPLIGSKEGIVELQLALLDPGDCVFVPDPGYAPYAAGARLAGAKVIPFSLQQGANFELDLESLEALAAEASGSGEGGILWLNYPSNPTGAVTSLSTLEEALNFATRHGLLLCHDAPYTEVWFGEDRPPSLMQVPGASDVAVEFHSLSKTCNMAGWRVGMAVGCPEALALLSRLKSNIDSGIFAPIQEAAVEALRVDEAWIRERNLIYMERLQVLCTALQHAGMSVSTPKASLYLWARLPEGTESEAFAMKLLEKTGVAVAPGTFFGPAGEGHIRVSCTQPTERIQEAARRFRDLD